MLGTMGSSMAGSMAGSALGNYMFSGSGGGGGQPVEGQAQGQQGQVAAGQPVCGLETKSFLQCMNETNNDFQRCDHIYDMFKQCQMRNLA